MKEFYLNKDGLTVDIYINGEPHTVKLSTITDIMLQLREQDRTEHVFVDCVGITEVIKTPALTKEEEEVLSEQAQHDRELKAEGQRIADANDRLFDEHKERLAEEWAEKTERDLAEREVIEELKREETM
jgi:hypothetical protein